MTQRSSIPSGQLYKLFFGKPVVLSNIAVTAFLLSAIWFVVVELPPLIPLPSYPVPTIPADYAALFGIIFFMTIILRKPFILLRYPRRICIAFISGITYRQRQDLCIYYTKRKMIECLLFLSVLFIVRYVFIFIFDKHITLSGLLLPEIPLFLFFGVLYHFSEKIIYSVPLSKKEDRSSQHQISNKLFKQPSNSPFIRFANIIAAAAKKPVHTMIIRIVLYILRKDRWGALFLQIAGMAISIVIALLLPVSIELLARALLLTAPVLLLSELREAIVGSIEKTFECPYYYFTHREIAKAAVYISSLVIIPYLLIYAVRQAINFHQFDILGFICFILSAIALSLVIGRSFLQSGTPGKKNGPATFFYSVPIIMCSLMPVIGIVLSSILIVVFGTHLTNTTLFNLNKQHARDTLVNQQP